MPAARDQRSLFGEILDWMLAPLLLLWPMSVALTWLVAQNIANRPYDRELGELARAVARQAGPAGNSAAEARRRFEQGAAALLRPDDSDTLYLQVLDGRGDVVAGDADLAAPVEAPATGAEPRFRDDVIREQPVRVASLRTGDDITVQLAETLDKRSRLATEIIKGVILPQFVILPLAVLLVWLALARGIRPLAELQQRIRLRDSSDLSPIEDHHVPEEVAPLVGAINDLLQRLDQSIATQRHFLADAAHQLKTPLAGLRMQAELAGRETDPERVQHSLRQIARASESAAHMVNQLLSMARAEDAEQALQREQLDLAEITMDTVRDFVPRAIDKRIDLGYENPSGAACFDGQPVLVRELVRNLVDNALRYTPCGGTVTARVTPDPFGQVVVLQVEDTGPGIAAAERELVFQPFYRALGSDADGSGLGLAIVAEIAKVHDADVAIGDAHPARSGTLVTVRFPVRAEAAA